MALFRERVRGFTFWAPHSMCWAFNVYQATRLHFYPKSDLLVKTLFLSLLRCSLPMLGLFHTIVEPLDNRPLALYERQALVKCEGTRSV